MSKFKYAKDGRLLFTKDMKEEFTILIPMMLHSFNLHEEYPAKTWL